MNCYKCGNKLDKFEELRAKQLGTDIEGLQECGVCTERRITVQMAKNEAKERVAHSQTFVL